LQKGVAAPTYDNNGMVVFAAAAPAEATADETTAKP
jgi:hypothetical protein